MRKNDADTPTAEISTPATAGPAILPLFWMMLLSVTALAKVSGVAMSLTNVRRAGLSTASAKPWATAAARTIQMLTTSIHTRTPSTSAGSMPPSAVHSRIVRLLYRSASTPASVVNSRVGNCWPATVTPSSRGESVSSSTSQACVSFCIQVPLTEIVCPSAYRR